MFCLAFAYDWWYTPTIQTPLTPLDVPSNHTGVHLLIRGKTSGEVDKIRRAAGIGRLPDRERKEHGCWHGNDTEDQCVPSLM